MTALLAGVASEPLVPPELLWIPLLLIAAKLSHVVERWGQAGVLGELLVGVLLGNLGLIGIDVLEPISTDVALRFLAEFGVVLLLFQTGLESSLDRMRAVGGSAVAVAVTGVVAPMALAAIVTPLVLPGLGWTTYAFVGAALTATSVGITARVFRDLGIMERTESQIVLGAAVLDDVLGLLLLAVLTGLLTTGSVSAAGILWIVAKALMFLSCGVVLGPVVAPAAGRILSRFGRGEGMKLALALSTALLAAFVAGLIGLAPIVGAFVAGLILRPVHFRDFDEPALVGEVRRAAAALPAGEKERLLNAVEPYAERHVESLIAPLAFVFVPIFFVITGMSVDLAVFRDPAVLIVAGILIVAAVVGKVVAGAASRRGRRMLIGWAMVPRGEVGLVFASIGRAAGVLNEQVFAAVVVVVIATTLITPPVLALLVRRGNRRVPPTALVS